MDIVRWAFNTTTWNPSEDIWQTLLQQVGKEEANKISRYVFKCDAKLSLGGRLLINKFLIKHANQLNIPVENVHEHVARTTKGKPYFKLNSTLHNYFIDFNVSNAGDYVIFTGIAGIPSENNKPLAIGCDVMKLEIRGRDKNLNNYFDSLDIGFTQTEWEFIKAPGSESEQLKRFYYGWTLKESYIKALGIGLGLELRRMQFFDTELATGSTNTSARLLLDNVHQTNWKFEQHCLGDSHVTAIAYGPLQDVEEEFRNLQYHPNSISISNTPGHYQPNPALPFEILQPEDLY